MEKASATRKCTAFWLNALLVALVVHAHAQTPSASWTNHYNGPGNFEDIATAVAVDSSGNVFVTGRSYGSGGGSDFATIKYSDAGVPLWTNRYNGPGGRDDQARALAVASSGNVFVTGYSAVSVVYPYDYDYTTVAYSGTGLPLWTNHYNGPGNTNDLAVAAAVDSSGNVIVTGSSTGSGGDFDYATIKYSGAGVPLWTNRYNGPGNGSDEAVALGVDSGGNVLVTGYSWNGSNFDYATIKYSGAGVPLWTNHYKGPGNGSDIGDALVVDSSDNVFVTGSSVGSGGFSDYATIKYSGAGVPLWTNRYSGPGNNEDFASALVVDSSGNVFVTGRSAVSGFVFDYATIKYSGAGVPLWTNRYDGGAGSDFPTALAVDSSGNVFVTGASFGSSGFLDHATIKYSGAGVPLWINRHNGPVNGHDAATALAVDSGDNVIVTGYSTGSASGYDYATIKYAAFPPPSGPILLTGAVLAGGAFRFQFNAEAGLTYAVEFRDVAVSTNWMTLTNLAAPPAATNLTVTNATTTNTRIYRVRTP